MGYDAGFQGIGIWGGVVISTQIQMNGPRVERKIFSRKPWRCSLLRNAKFPDSGVRGGSPFRIQQLIADAIAIRLFD